MDNRITFWGEWGHPTKQEQVEKGIMFRIGSMKLFAWFVRAAETLLIDEKPKYLPTKRFKDRQQSEIEKKLTYDRWAA